MSTKRLKPGQRPPGHPELLSPVFWREAENREANKKGGSVVLIDQRRLPEEESWSAYDDPSELARAIRDMEVRGAPAIGCTAAFALALAAARTSDRATLAEIARALLATRPTAVNLAAALRRMQRALEALAPSALAAGALAEAQAIWDEDLAACHAIGRHGAALLPAGATILTHCNAGGLATAGYGTALGVIRAAVAAGKVNRVLCDETRPWLQGARLTAWELRQDGIDAQVIVDGAAGHFLSRGEIAAVVVGADRIAANGDCANKIGTVGVAASCHAFGVPFYVAAPSTTLDPETPTGAQITIEERDPGEVLSIGGKSTAAAGTPARNPVFDVTPARLVTAIVTEKGVFRAPFRFRTTPVDAEAHTP